MSKDEFGNCRGLGNKAIKHCRGRSAGLMVGQQFDLDAKVIELEFGGVL
jgi:hypothetical protein